MAVERVKEEIYTCTRCGFCRSAVDYKRGVNLICPMGERYGMDTFFARGRVGIARLIYEGKIRNFDSSLLERIYHCLTCGNCMAHCSSMIDTLSIFFALREEAIKNGNAPLEVHKKFLKNLKDFKNLYGGKEFTYEYEGRTGNTLLFTGCSFYYDRGLKNVVEKSVELLLKSGIEPVIFKDEICCGDFAKRIGDLSTFNLLKEENLSKMKERGIKEIITICSHCYRTFKMDYELKDIKVSHIVEVIKKKMRERKLKPKRGESAVVTYHDPCYLGRHTKILEPQRDIIKMIEGVRFVEMKRTKENAWCCGAGGGIMEGFPLLANEIAAERLADVPDGVDYLLTSCPFCIMNLRKAGKKADYYIGDLVEFLIEFF
jgi:Fe-S oxidoreductase